MIYAIIVLLVVLSAFFSASEIAYASASKVRLKRAAQTGKKSSMLADRISDRFTEFLSTVLIGNNLVNIAASSAATILGIELAVKSGLTSENGQLISAAVITVIILVFGEIFPKIIATTYADNAVALFAYPIRFFMILFKPIVWAVTSIMNKLSPLWTPKDTQPQVTQEELVTILETIEDEGVFTDKESELIRSAIDFSDVTARDIMIPRVDVVAFDIDDGVEKLMENEELRSFSRFPVYEGSFDNVIGILQTKQFMKSVVTDPNTDIRSLLVPPVYVHMTRSISSILLEFRKKKAHMALVIDEYGGVMGILTVEDIVEEIVGDIFDEGDVVESEIEQKTENTFEVEGGMNIYDMFDMIGFECHDFESEYTTVGGWATEMLDKFPVKGDHFTYENLSITVIEAQAVRVEKLLIEVLPVSDEEE